MALDDLPAVARLGASHFTHENVSYSYWSLAELADHFGTHPGYCLVAEVGGRFAGFALGAPGYNDLPMAHLEWLAVEPELRRLGVGRRLCETFFGIAARAGLTRVLMDVESTNPGAMAFCRRLGLSEHTRITFWAKDLVPGSGPCPAT
jgi:ribosomal protein S18 acetylase RimI-like enzyme